MKFILKNENNDQKQEKELLQRIKDYNMAISLLEQAKGIIHKFNVITDKSDEAWTFDMYDEERDMSSYIQRIKNGIRSTEIELRDLKKKK